MSSEEIKSLGKIVAISGKGNDFTYGN